LKISNKSNTDYNWNLEAIIINVAIIVHQLTMMHFRSNDHCFTLEAVMVMLQLKYNGHLISLLEINVKNIYLVENHNFLKV